MDFTIRMYTELLQAMQAAGYSFSTLEAFLRNPTPNTFILRHDVDAMPQNSLAFAQIQHSQNIRGVYYFRATSGSWNDRIIRQIADMGHEVGYHYECLTTCKGNKELAILDFEKNLTALRRLAPVSTICMHGSPMSKYDSKDLWKTYSYSDFDIVGEPYLDVDFSKVAYLTDTGRRWDGHKVSVRDKVNAGFNHPFRSTADLIAGLKNKQLSSQVMFTFHPQRWNNNPIYWLQELVFQKTKNVVKQYFYVK
ncbi:hypothetical protein [Spirosoma oryzicola]|uniref:hypothetical protein n=1 Tax=Spirosoma oryzicola TaxID=2898794 RepID=UPI001E4BB281|nr:hypothetical protein [Spirosoma oryzicola]UHG94021.1 hypothetical protein LQ777_25980 [Spirosoma oryzicola]